MTESMGTSATPANWYPDPAGSADLRWWDGTRWTNHYHDPNAELVAAVAKPVAGPRTPVYNPFIWIIVLAPLLSVLALAVWDMSAYLTQSATGLPPVPDPGYLLITGLGWVLYLGNAVLAFLDWRALDRAGYLRPFHWAWTFLSSTVYVVGRSIIVNRRAGRGVAPIWALAGLLVLSSVVVAAKVVDAVATVMVTVPTAP